MRLHANSLLAGAAAALAIAASSCGSTQSTADSGTQAVEVSFKFKVNGQAFSCADTYAGVGNNPDAGAQVYRGSYARFYVHEVTLVDHDGEEAPVTLTADGLWQLPSAGVVEIDGENGGTCAGASGNLKVVGTVPAGSYHGLKFKVGLPASVNHLLADSQPSPLNQSAMFWSWTSGYRFLRVEGLNASKAGLSGGLLHLGSTGCTPVSASDPTQGASCTYPNTVDVSFPMFHADSNSVVLDIGHLFADTNLVFNGGGATGCMSGLTDPECPVLFRKLGLPYGDGFQPDGGFTVVTPDAGQSAFTME